jgi:cystathionine beta-lyase
MCDTGWHAHLKIKKAEETKPFMTYDFDEIIDRVESDCIKWRHYDRDALPMWVADMDFRSPEPVIRALHERVEHGIFGYAEEPCDLRDLIVDRLQRMYGWQVAPEAIVFLSGVVTGFNLVCAAFASPGDGVLVQTPVYPPILSAPRHHRLVRQATELVRGVDGRYSINLDAFEASISERSRLFLLCNPHNPVGRVFTPAELAGMADICLRHDLLICSDEIHCDLVFNGHPHTPIAALDPAIAARTITLMAPSKTYNIAGLNCSFAVVENSDLRKQFQAGRAGMVGDVNLLGFTAALAAYRDGQPWLDELLSYLKGNRDLLVDYVNQKLPGVRTIAPEGTYLAWLDCRQADLSGKPFDFFLERARVAVNDGATFGQGGEGFVRLNFGCPRSLLVEGLERMRAGLESVLYSPHEAHAA